MLPVRRRGIRQSSLRADDTSPSFLPITQSTKGLTGTVSDVVDAAEPVVTETVGTVDSAAAPVTTAPQQIAEPAATDTVETAEAATAPIVETDKSAVTEVVEPVTEPVVTSVTETIEPAAAPVVSTVEQSTEAISGTIAPVIDGADGVVTEVVEVIEPAQPVVTEVVEVVDSGAAAVDHLLTEAPRAITGIVTDLVPASEPIVEPINELLPGEPVIEPIVNETVGAVVDAVTGLIPATEPIVGPIEEIVSPEPGTQPIPGDVISPVTELLPGAIPALRTGDEALLLPGDPAPAQAPHDAPGWLVPVVGEPISQATPTTGVATEHPVSRPEPAIRLLSEPAGSYSTLPGSASPSGFVAGAQPSTPDMLPAAIQPAPVPDPTASTPIVPPVYEEILWWARALGSPLMATVPVSMPHAALALIDLAAAGSVTAGSSGPVAAMLALLLALSLVPWRALQIATTRIPPGILQTVPTPPG
jgi:hypothetical protein